MPKKPPRKKAEKLIVCGSTDTSSGKPCQIKYKKGKNCHTHGRKKNKKPSESKPKKPKKPKTKKTAPKKKETEKTTHTLLSITALARKFNLDRATVRERLVSINPDKIEGAEKLYDLKAVQFLLSQDAKAKAQLRKLQAEADLKEHSLAVQRGEYASAKEFADITQKIFSKLFQKLAVDLPGKNAKKLHKANSAAELKKMLQKEIGKEFDNLRDDFKKYL